MPKVLPDLAGETYATVGEQTIPGSASVPWKNFFVMSYAAKTLTYIEGVTSAHANSLRER